VVEAYQDLSYPVCREVDLGPTSAPASSSRSGKPSTPPRTSSRSSSRRPPRGLGRHHVSGRPPTRPALIAAVYDFNEDGLLDVLITDSALAGST